jgi:hypothetical protein
MLRAYQPWLWVDWIYYLTSAGRRYKSALKTVHEFADEVEERKDLKLYHSLNFSHIV